MAIVKFGVTIVGIRGTLGGVTFSANGSTPYAKSWSRGANPKTPIQTAVRGLLAQMPAVWRDLSGAQQDDWDVFAALPAQDLVNSLGESYSISGWGWFTKVNIRLLTIGRPTRDTVPTQSRPSAPAITGLEFPFEDGETAFVSYASATFDPDFDLVLEIAQAASLGRVAAPSSFLEFRVIQNPDDTQTSFAAQYTNRLGIGNASMKGFARLYRQTTDGLRSSAGAASFIASDSSPYAPGALDYNGSADYALRGADLTGAVDSKVCTVAGWFNAAAGAGTFRSFAENAGVRYRFRLTSANRLQFQIDNAAGTLVVNLTTLDAYADGSGWHSFLLSINTAVPSFQLYVDRAVPSMSTTTVDFNESLAFARSDHSFGASVLGAAFWDGCLSSFWMSFVDALDFDDVAVRRIFLSPTGAPLDLGDSGQLPTGTPPIVYFPDGDASNNVGTGGNYTNQSGSSACADAP